MLNQVVLVGRIASEVKVEETESGKKSAKMTIGVPRSFKNMDGEYETDFVDITLFDSIATNTTEYCRKGDIVGVKGRIQSTEIEKFHSKMKVLEVIAERITFLSSKSDKEQD